MDRLSGVATPTAVEGAVIREDEGVRSPVVSVPAVLTVDEVAALLRINRKTVYEIIRRGELPGVRKMGRTLRVSRDAVLEWLANGQGRVSRRGR